MSRMRTGTPTRAWNRATWSRYAWPRAGEEWSASYGDTASMWRTLLLPRIGRFLPCTHAVEIGCGHGRCSRWLLDHCEQLTLVDLTPSCVDACRRRFGLDPRVRYFLNDGRSLPVDAADFVFSWDSLVHADPESLAAYLRALAVVLTPGGIAWIHHSNLGAYPALGHRWRSLHARHPHASAARARADAVQAGLVCFGQELVPWGGTSLFLDAFSTFGRSGPEGPTVANDRWLEEIATAQAAGRGGNHRNGAGRAPR